MVNERPQMLEQSATIYFGPWYRRSPYFEASRAAGCTAYDVYNHMLLPSYFDDPLTEYWALLNDVTVWDVAVERTVEISGRDADRFIDSLTCRDLTKCQVKQGKYMIVTAPDGDRERPVLLHVGENRWWMQLADSDAGLYATGVAAASNMDVEIAYPHAYPMQVQGAKAAKTVEKLAGPGIYDLKYYWCDWFEIAGIQVLISRTGWTAVQGFEINILDPDRGTELWTRCSPRARSSTSAPWRRSRRDASRPDHELGLGHELAGHGAAHHGVRTPRRGPAAGLHRQGGTGVPEGHRGGP
jgi:aminomethyltransferase